MYSKYGAKKVFVDGIKFDSKLESNFYLYLKNHPTITLLDTQVKIILLPKLSNLRAITYVADFLIEYQGEEILVDSKGVETAVFKLKKNLFERFHPEKILITAKSVKEFELLLEKTKELIKVDNNATQK